MDKVFVSGLELEAKHGYYDEERQMGNRFRFDVAVSTQTADAARSDDLDETVDYSKVAALIKKAASGPSAKLVETLAAKIANSILEEFASAKQVRVRVAKLDPPGTEGAEQAGVEIERDRG
ncbi:MAG: dihydroneopterin aldolase [Fimbriimonadales bacterium]